MSGKTHEEFMSIFTGLSQSSRHRIERAYIFSKDAHRGQKRKGGDRYFEHPREVALILAYELGLSGSSDLIVTALLHDVVEDTRYITIPFIKDDFGNRVADWVEALTKRPEKTDYWERLRDAVHEGAALVKLADRLHNLRSLPGCKPEFIRKQLDDTYKNVYPLIAHWSNRGDLHYTSELYDHHFDHLRELIIAQAFSLETT